MTILTGLPTLATFCRTLTHTPFVNARYVGRAQSKPCTCIFFTKFPRFPAKKGMDGSLAWRPYLSAKPSHGFVRGPQHTAQPRGHARLNSGSAANGPTVATLTPPLGLQQTAQARGHARPNNNHSTWTDNSRKNSCLSFHFIDWIYRGNRYSYTHPFPLSPSAIATDGNDSDAISPWAT